MTDCIGKKGLLLFNASFGEHLCIIDNTGMILQNCQKKKTIQKHLLQNFLKGLVLCLLINFEYQDNFFMTQIISSFSLKLNFYIVHFYYLMSPKILERAQSGLAKSKAKAKNRKENLLGIHFLFSSALIPFFFKG